MYRSTSTTMIALILGAGLLAATVFSPTPVLAAKKSAPASSTGTSTGCSGSDNPVIARVNGDPICRTDIQATLQQIIPQGQTPSQDDLKKLYPRIVDDLISRKLAYQQAVQMHLNNESDVRHAVSMAEHQIMEQAYFNEVGKPAVTDEAMRKAYDEAVKTAPKQDEVHARHILVKTEDEAKEIIKQLDKGADFQTLAKEKSIDKGNAADGGDLGYFTKGAMDPAFADAAFSMEPNTYSKTPVKTGFGYHVIQVLDKRPAKIPTFEEAKPQLRSQLAQAAITAKLKDAAAKSKIEVFNPDGTPITQQPTAAAAAAPPPSTGAAAPLKLPETPTNP